MSEQERSHPGQQIELTEGELEQVEGGSFSLMTVRAAIKAFLLTIIC